MKMVKSSEVALESIRAVKVRSELPYVAECESDGLAALLQMLVRCGFRQVGVVLVG